MRVSLRVHRSRVVAIRTPFDGVAYQGSSAKNLDTYLEQASSEKPAQDKVAALIAAVDEVKEQLIFQTHLCHVYQSRAKSGSAALERFAMRIQSMSDEEIRMHIRQKYVVDAGPNFEVEDGEETDASATQR